MVTCLLQPGDACVGLLMEVVVTETAKVVEEDPDELDVLEDEEEVEVLQQPLTSQRLIVMEKKQTWHERLDLQLQLIHESLGTVYLRKGGEQMEQDLENMGKSYNVSI